MSKVNNLDWFPHVKDEDFTSMSHGASFEHESAGLGDEHEVTDDVGMSDLDWSAFLDLLAEDRDDGTI